MVGISSGHLSEGHIPDYAATQPGPYSDRHSHGSSEPVNSAHGEDDEGWWTSRTPTVVISEPPSHGKHSDYDGSDKDPPLPAYSQASTVPSQPRKFIPGSHSPPPSPTQPPVPHLHTDNQRSHHSRSVPSNSSDYVIVGSQNQFRRGRHEYHEHERDRLVHNGNGRPDPYYKSYDSVVRARRRYSRSSSPSSHSRTTTRRSGIFIFILAISLVLCLALASPIFLKQPRGDICDPETRERVREEWQKERSRWDRERAAWEEERSAHLEFSGKMREERKTFEHELTKMSQDRIKWEQERREQGNLEQNWQKAREAQERKEKRWRELEEEWERRRSAYHWTYPNPGARCLAYGEREWTAELITNDEQANVEVACYATSIEIRGTNMGTPDVCTNVGGWGKVKWQGHWKVRNDPGCKTYWEEWQDKGCTNPGSGIRRLNARLSNLRGGDDGSIMCATTPASYNGRILVGDQSCEDWGSRRGFWHGIWDIEDLSSCQPNKLAAANTSASLETAAALTSFTSNTQHQ